MPVGPQNTAKAKPQVTPNFCRSSAELRPNSHMLPSRTEPNIRPNCSAELRRSPNFGPSLLSNGILLFVFCGQKDCPNAIHSEMHPVYGDKCFTKPAISIFCNKFALKRKSVVREKRRGHCVVSMTDH